MRLVLHDRAVHALLDPLADLLLGLQRGGVLLLQISHQRFPFTQFGIAQHGVLNYLVALVFALQRGGAPVRFGGADKIPQRRIEYGRLAIEVDNRRRRAFQAQRVSPGLSQPGAQNELGDVLVPRLAVGSKDALLIGIGRSRGGAVGQRQFDGALERQRLGGQSGQGERGNDQKATKTRNTARSKVHLVTFQRNSMGLCSMISRRGGCPHPPGRAKPGWFCARGRAAITLPG